ncbi:MAG TPA: Gfo/Idh/MocA family oxidoreductase [Terriglobales bacterium]|nr:Gfo/Idh/MocA family oxidoreductase [Terriglobales bacterium]
MGLKIGIVGCGKIADRHVAEIQELGGPRVLAICDLEPILAEQLALRFSVPYWYTDFDRMLSDHRLDVIHIASPPHSHLALAQKSAEAGCHVFIEKPLALNATDGRRLIECLDRANRKMTINYWYNFETPALALKEFVARGNLGDPVHVESYYGYDLAGEFGRALFSDDRHWVHQLPGRLFQNVVDHAINKITPFLPDGPMEIIARGYRRQKMNNDRTDDILDELRVMILVGGMSAYVTFCSTAQPVSHFMRVYGTKNTAHIDFALRSMLVEEKQTIPGALGRLLPSFKSSLQSLTQATHNAREFAGSRFQFFAGMNRLLSLFYESILHDTPVPIPYEEILRVSQIMDEIFTQVYPKAPA